MKEINKYITLFLVAIGVRLLLSLFYIKNHFIGSFIPYPLQPDPFYFYYIFNSVPKIILVIIPLIAIGISSIIFYKILSKLEVKDSFLFSILFSMFYSVIMQSYVGYVDTPALILLLFLLVCNSIFEKSKLYTVITFAYGFLMLFLWEGTLKLLLFLFVVSIITYIAKYKSKKWILVGGLLCSVIAYPIIKQYYLFFNDMNLVRELQPNITAFFILFLIFYCMFLFDNLKLKKFNQDELFFLIIGLFLSFGSFLQRRWTYLGVTIMLISILIFQKRYNLRLSKFIKYCLIMFTVLGLVVASIQFSILKPFITNQDELDLRDIDTNNEIIGSWNYGHLYKYFTKGDILYLGHPLRENKYFDVLRNKTYENTTVIIEEKHYYKYNVTINCTMLKNNKFKVFEC